MITRGRSLSLIAVSLLAGCDARVPGGVRVGSDSTGENATIAEIYAMALERSGIPVQRRLGLNDPRSALTNGAIDLYPAFVTNTPAPMPAGLALLAASATNDSPCLVTSQYAVEKFWTITLSKCARLASHMRFAASRDFVAPGGELDRLQHFYGGFRFEQIVVCDPGTQMGLLNRDEADIANAFTTEAAISNDQLIILKDDRNFWPQEHLAPIVRVAVLRSHPRIRTVLNRVSAELTQYGLQELNRRREVLDLDPRSVAEDFINGVTR